MPLLIIVTGASNPDFSLATLGLSENTPIQEIQDNFVMKVTRMLTNDDLLILTSGTHQYHGFGLSNGLVEPEALVRLKPDIATIVAHFPILN